MFNNYYKDKKVFVTGHTGFKGSWLVLWLLALGAIVKGYALEPYTKDDHYVVLGLDSKIESVIADVRDLDSLKKEMADFQPDVVFHLAAQPLVRASYFEPVATYATNVIGTVNVLDAVRECSSVKSFVNVTTDKCYENVEKTEGYKEDEPMGGYDPYSSSKGCSELVTAAYRRSFFFDKDVFIATARAGNVIGGGDWCKDRIMTDSINSLMQNEPIKIRNPQATRPWQHVLEPLSGYLLLASQANAANKQAFAQGWNFGPDSIAVSTVGEVVDLVIEHWGSGSWQDVSNAADLHEAKLLQLDITKAKTQLQWLPVLNEADSIRYTVQWYKNYAAKKVNYYKFSLSQLKEYCNSAKIKNIEWAG